MVQGLSFGASGVKVLGDSIHVRVHPQGEVILLQPK